MGDVGGKEVLRGQKCLHSNVLKCQIWADFNILNCGKLEGKELLGLGRVDAPCDATSAHMNK